MKTIHFTFAALLSLLLMAACSEKNDVEQMTNYLSLTVQGTREIAEDDNTPITLKASLSFTPDEDVTAKLLVTGNDDEVVTLSAKSLEFKKGVKEQTITITSNRKHIVKGSRAITISATDISNAHIKLKEPVSVSIRQDSDIPALSEAQQALIKGYKEKYDIDLMRLLGKVKVKATVNYNAGDKDQYFKGKESDTFNGYTIITLSDKATPEKPVLKMVSNAMGLNDFFYAVIRMKTVDDTEFFRQQPHGLAAYTVVKFDPATDTFTTALDNIVINVGDKSTTFTGTIKNSLDEDIIAVPFAHTFSASDRLEAIAKKGNVTVKIKLPYEDREQSILVNEDMLKQGGSISPTRWLNHSTIDKDDFKNNPSDYVSPSSSFDYRGGKLSFTFPWDFDEANGYTRMHVEYTF